MRDRAIKGAFWSYGSYGVQFLIQAVALVVLARQLGATDFGVFALGLMIVGIGEAVFQLSFGSAIVQLEHITDEHIDVAWTSNVLFSLLATAIMGAITWAFVGAGTQAWATKGAVLAMLSSTLLTAFSSSGLLLLQRNLQTRDMVGIALTRVLLRYGGAILLALWIRDFRALIIAYLAGFAAEMAMSHYIAPRRSRFVWNGRIFRELFRFSGWLHLKKLSFWGGRYVDSFVVNALLGVASLGVYNRAFNLASLPNNQALVLSFRVFAPLFASARHEPERLARLVRHAFNVTLLTTVPVLLVMMLHGETLIRMILGEKWSAASGVLGVLSLGLLLRSLNDVQAIALRAAGQPRFEFVISGVQVAVTAATLVPAILWKGLAGAGYALVLGNVVAVVITERLMRGNVGISLRSQGTTLAGVLAGAAAAWAVSRSVSFSYASITGELTSAALELAAFFLVQVLVFLPARGGVLQTLWWAGHRLLEKTQRPAAGTLHPQRTFSA